MININETFSAQLTRVFLLTVLITVVGGPIAAHAEDCYNVIRLDTNTKTERFGLNGSDVEIFEVEVTDRGILTFSAVAPLTASADLKLGLFGDSCRPAVTLDGSQLIKRFTSEVALHVDTPGTYRFGVALQDPTDSLDAFSVSAHFIDDINFCESLCLTAKAIHEVEPDPDLYKAIHKVEPDPDLYTACFSKAIHEVEPDPDLYKAIHEVEPDPDLYTACFTKAIHEVEPDPDLLQITLSSLPVLAVADDHADVFFLATPLTLGRELAANLDNRWEEDSDVFTFSLPTQTTVRIAFSEAKGMLAGLYDRHGQELEVLGSDTDSHTAMTLAAGRYYVRVEGSAINTGSYNVSVEVLGW